MQKILMMDLLFKNQAQLELEQALIFHRELLMQLMYSLIVIQDLLVLVQHQVAQSPSRTEIPHNLNVNDKINSFKCKEYNQR